MSEVFSPVPCEPCAINEQLFDHLSRYAAYQHGVVETFAEGTPEYPPLVTELADKRSILPTQAQAAVACIYMKLAGKCADECQK